MVVQQSSNPDLDESSVNQLNGSAPEGEAGDYRLVMADRRVDEASRRVAEQIRVVSEIGATGDSSEQASNLLHDLQQELKLLTERREAVRLEALDGGDSPSR